MDLYEGANWADRVLMLLGAALTVASTKVPGKTGAGVICLGGVLLRRRVLVGAARLSADMLIRFAPPGDGAAGERNGCRRRLLVQSSTTLRRAPPSGIWTRHGFGLRRRIAPWRLVDQVQRRRGAKVLVRQCPAEQSG